jgi:hypothetical protein
MPRLQHHTSHSFNLDVVGLSSDEFVSNMQQGISKSYETAQIDGSIKPNSHKRQPGVRR